LLRQKRGHHKYLVLGRESTGVEVPTHPGWNRSRPEILLGRDRADHHGRRGKTPRTLKKKRLRAHPGLVAGHESGWRLAGAHKLAN